MFDDRDYVNKPFPELDPATSFPYEPVFDQPGDETVKVPSWLNDPTLYHNRGDSTYSGENSTYGDFSGLDDLFTENPEVVSGMEDIYKAWVDLGIDGFRIDTVKHVNLEFWQQFSPAILEHARARGNDDFFMFGEVYDGNPAYLSTFTTAGKLPATLDFGFQNAAQQFVAGKNATQLRDLFAGDDYYTDTDSNAYELPTFLGNHDMGRLPALLGTVDDKLKRVELANQLMFLTRGQPVTYYGDEQGFIGAGGDKDARQDMFATKTKQYADEANLYGAGKSGAKDRYATDTDLYLLISELSKLRSKNPTLADGAQISRYAARRARGLRVQPDQPRRRSGVPGGGEQLDRDQDRRLRHLQREDALPAGLRHRHRCPVPAGRTGEGQRSRDGGLGLEGRAAVRRRRRCPGAAGPGARQRGRLHRPGQDQRSPSGRPVRPGDGLLATGGG